MLKAMMAMSVLAAFMAPPEAAGGGAAPQGQPAGAPPLPPPPPVQTGVPQETLAQYEARLRSEAEARAKAEAELKAFRDSQLTSEQRMQAQIEELRRANQEADARRAQELQVAQIQARNGQLVAYRADLLRQIGEDRLPSFLHGQVFGQDEGEIYRNAMNAMNGYAAHMQAEEAKIRSRVAQQLQGPQVPPAPGIPPGAVPGVQSPYAPAAPQAQQTGFPTPIQGMAPPPPQQVNLGELTSEDAVRSGKYAQNRQAILSALKSGQAPVLGQTQVQQQAPAGGVQYQQGPFGQMQPQHGPMAPVAPPWYQQQQQTQGQVPPPPPAQVPQQVPPQQGWTPPAPPQVQVTQGPNGGIQADTHQQALDAIRRTHAGSNPVMGQQPPGAASALQQMQNAGLTGQNPVTVFQSRFTHTPPLPAPQAAGSGG